MNSFRMNEIGFHGDQNLISLVEEAVSKSEYFLETGTHHGRSLKFIASQFLDKSFLSCEVEKDKCLTAIENCSGLQNVSIENMSSEDFLEEKLKKLNLENSTFWLDAHWSSAEDELTRAEIKKYANQPLKSELELITSTLSAAKIFVDDMVVPHNDTFFYDVYGGVESSFENIRESIGWENFSLIYPDYDPNFDTMYHEPRGWCLIADREFGEVVEESFGSITKVYNI